MPVKMNPNRNAMKGIKTELAAHIHIVGKEVEQVAKRSMRRSGSPSRAGETPRIDTKNLHESITTETEVQGDRVETRVGTNIGYGLHLELGTRFMKPRPWLRPALQAVRGKDR